MLHNKKPSRIGPFVIGLILGILSTIYVPQYVRPYLPESISMVEKGAVVKGNVTAKEKKGDALLLTVSTPEGVLLATFRNKADEVNLLINEKDEVQFALPKYMPFVEDPEITRIVKAQQAVPAPAEAPAAPPVPEGKRAKAMKPQHQVKRLDRGSGALPTDDTKTEQ